MTVAYFTETLRMSGRLTANVTCPTCGREPEREDRFCRSCGTPVAWAPVAPPAAVLQSPGPQRDAVSTLRVLALVATIAALVLYQFTGSVVLFATCCVPAAFALLALVVVGAAVRWRKSAFRGDLL